MYGQLRKNRRKAQLGKPNLWKKSVTHLPYTKRHVSGKHKKHEDPHVFQRKKHNNHRFKCICQNPQIRNSWPFFTSKKWFELLYLPILTPSTLIDWTPPPDDLLSHLNGCSFTFGKLKSGRQSEDEKADKCCFCLYYPGICNGYIFQNQRTHFSTQPKVAGL